MSREPELREFATAAEFDTAYQESRQAYSLPGHWRLRAVGKVQLLNLGNPAPNGNEYGVLVESAYVDIERWTNTDVIVITVWIDEKMHEFRIDESTPISTYRYFV